MHAPPSISEIQRGLTGAWRLFRRDPSGVTLFAQGEDAFWKSFWCAVIIAPAYVVMIALTPGEVTLVASLPRTLAVEVIAYSIGWTAWPVVMASVFTLLGIREKYIPYIVAYSWASGPQIALLLTLTVIASVLALPLGQFILLNLIAFVWFLIYHGYIIRVTTNLKSETIVLLVVGEAVLSFAINNARHMVMQGVF